MKKIKNPAPRPAAKRKGQAASIGHGWAWMFPSWIIAGKWEMCHWVEPHKQKLLSKSPPTPEAKVVHVAIVPMGLWKRLKGGLSPRKTNTSARKRKK